MLSPSRTSDPRGNPPLEMRQPIEVGQRFRFAPVIAPASYEAHAGEVLTVLAVIPARGTVRVTYRVQAQPSGWVGNVFAEELEPMSLKQDGLDGKAYSFAEIAANNASKAEAVEREAATDRLNDPFRLLPGRHDVGYPKGEPNVSPQRAAGFNYGVGNPRWRDRPDYVAFSTLADQLREESAKLNALAWAADHALWLARTAETEAELARADEAIDAVLADVLKLNA